MNLKIQNTVLIDDASLELYGKMREYYSTLILLGTFEYYELLNDFNEFTFETAQDILDMENFVIDRSYYEDDETGEPIIRYKIRRAMDAISTDKILFRIERQPYEIIEAFG